MGGKNFSDHEPGPQAAGYGERVSAGERNSRPLSEKSFGKRGCIGKCTERVLRVLFSQPAKELLQFFSEQTVIITSPCVAGNTAG